MITVGHVLFDLRISEPFLGGLNSLLARIRSYALKLYRHMHYSHVSVVIQVIIKTYVYFIWPFMLYGSFKGVTINQILTPYHVCVFVRIEK